MPRVTTLRLLVTSGLVLCNACLSVGASAQSAWLPALPTQTEIEHMRGGVSVNGVHLEVALAKIPLSLDQARRRIARSWSVQNDEVRSVPFRDGWLLSRRVGSNHDTVTLQAQLGTATRAVFSRASLAAAVTPAACQFTVPRSWVLISATRSMLAGSSTDQCMYRRSSADRDAFAGLDALWRRDGWRLASLASNVERSAQRLVRWSRETSRRTAIFEPGGVSGLVLIMAGATAP
jgi:hypothetical protein